MKKKFSLRRTWERVRTVPGLGRNVLTVIVLITLGVISASVILGNQRFILPWSDRYVFSADFAQAPAINPGQQPKVRIAGVEVGQITGSAVTGTGTARLTMSLEPGNTIYRNAHLVLRPTNPLNEMYVEVDPGGPPQPALPANGVIPVGQTERPVQPDEVLDHLDDRSRAALTNLLSASDVALANAPATLPGGLRAADGTMVAVKPVLDALAARRDNIAKLVTGLSRISGAVGHNDARLAQLLDSTQSTLSVLAQHNADVQATLAELPGTTDQLRRAMDGVSGLTSRLNPVLDHLDQASAQLPATLRKLGGTVDSLGATVAAAKPVVAAAGPVVRDVSPLVGDVHRSLADLEPVTRDLIPDSALLVSYLGDLQAFIYNTNGAFSLSDANGGFIRGHVAVPLPDAGVLPGTHGGNTGGSHP
ncbi:MlaD family protein [Amycolatopsis saalfeldensis]|uniref:Phospholipid/cholesterol/gamma-HCH transport system substrate-binding protein n=1 Tax=Amycolatopsis saalfeldensis TaxID=394193 RepID=A0A1H8Y946_9PSEU|nr:MlaD family protein [Amycolatopsis saalfeldensis]SEP48659.1 phospholipid/cholesterol/gamma-HCH transport system substrate-binding protein [Amycolatopsis saalfeldensis]